MDIYTRAGDDGSTGLLFGGREAKNTPRLAAVGAADEAQAALGVARAASSGELAERLLRLGRDLWILMAELATEKSNRPKLTDGETRVTQSMIEGLEATIDEVVGRFDPPTEFVVPGGSELAARLDLARTVVRRAERAAVTLSDDESLVVPYLNRLSDTLWVLARWAEGESTTARP